MTWLWHLLLLWAYAYLTQLTSSLRQFLLGSMYKHYKVQRHLLCVQQFVHAAIVLP